MKTKKILLSFVSIIGLCFSGVTLNSCGKSPSVNDLIFLPIIEEGKIGFSEYVVYGRKSSSSTDIIIPSKYNGMPVTIIGDDAFAGCSSLESITIPRSINEIGESAFAGCDKLENITIPNGVTSIDKGTFEGCYSLKMITIPKSVTTIDYAAFAGCSSLRVIVYKGTIKQWINVDIAEWNQCLTNATVVFR